MLPLQPRAWVSVSRALAGRQRRSRGVVGEGACVQGASQTSSRFLGDTPFVHANPCDLAGQGPAWGLEVGGTRRGELLPLGADGPVALF